MTKNKIRFRFYEELNDFLPAHKKKVQFEVEVNIQTTVKDQIESMGVPHTEIDLILVNGKSVTFDYKLTNGDEISVYPMFESLDIRDVTRLRPKPLRESKFILDVHLGKLAKYLRMFGFDTLYRNDFEDPEIVRIAKNEHRIVLTRDLGILKHNDVTHGYFLRSQDSKKQLLEVIERFDLLKSFKPFHRCIDCNGLIKKVEKSIIIDKLKPNTEMYFNEFFQCQNCKKVYWEGSHFQKMKTFVENIINI